MFSHLFDLSFKRTPFQALGFYITYLIIVMVIVSVIGIVTEVGVDKDSSEYGNGARLGTFFAIIACSVLAFLVMKAKKHTSSLTLILFTATSAVLALIGGGVAGLIIPAVFTTRKKGTKG